MDPRNWTSYFLRYPLFSNSRRVTQTQYGMVGHTSRWPAIPHYCFFLFMLETLTSYIDKCGLRGLLWSAFAHDIALKLKKWNRRDVKKIAEIFQNFSLKKHICYETGRPQLHLLPYYSRPIQEWIFMGVFSTSHLSRPTSEYELSVITPHVKRTSRGKPST